MLFFHGFGSSRVVRHPDDSIAARLGHPHDRGRSSRNRAVDGDAGRRLLDWPADVRQLADELGLERFAILGWSGGGPYALACAWSMPDRVAAVGLISSRGATDRSA